MELVLQARTSVSGEYFRVHFGLKKLFLELRLRFITYCFDLDCGKRSVSWKELDSNVAIELFAHERISLSCRDYSIITKWDRLSGNWESLSQRPCNWDFNFLRGNHWEGDIVWNRKQEDGWVREGRGRGWEEGREGKGRKGGIESGERGQGLTRLKSDILVVLVPLPMNVM